jgi:hypothetical protein
VIAGAIVLSAWAWVADGPWLERHAHEYRCLRDAALVETVRLERGAAVVLALVLVVLVRPRAGRFVEKQKPEALARVGFAVLAALLATELILRARPATGGAPCDYCPDVRASDDYLWGLQPSSAHAWRDFTYYVNAEGNRARSVDALPDHARPTILIAGESIALGMGVGYERTFGALLEARTGVQTVNVAVHGFGADQAYARLAEAIASFDRPIAVVTVFVPEEATRAEIEDHPHLVADGLGGLTRAPPKPAWLRDVRVRTLFRRAIDYHGDAEIADLRAVARATAELARRRGAYPLFVTTNFERPCVDVDGKGPWLFRTTFDDQGLARVHVHLGPEAKATPLDPHPGPYGHRLLADAVEGALRAAHAL